MLTSVRDESRTNEYRGRGHKEFPVLHLDDGWCRDRFHLRLQIVWINEGEPGYSSVSIHSSHFFFKPLFFFDVILYFQHFQTDISSLPHRYFNMNIFVSSRFKLCRHLTFKQPHFSTGRGVFRICRYYRSENKISGLEGRYSILPLTQRC